MLCDSRRVRLKVKRIVRMKEESRLSEMLPTHMGELSTLERKVAKYLLKHEDKIQSLDIADIAKNADVSKATVVRFCKALGFNGLKDFKIYYEAGKSDFPNKLSKIEKANSSEEINSIWYNALCRAAEKNLTPANINVISGIAKSLKDKKKVTLIYSDECLTSDAIFRRLSQIGYDVSTYSISEAASKSLNPEGMLFIVELEGDSNELSPTIKRAKENKVPVAIISPNSRSWMAANADFLLIPFNEKILDADKIVVARIGAMMFIEEICILVSNSR